MRAGWLALQMGAMLIGASLAGCATPSHITQPLRSAHDNHAQWQGRISVQVQGHTPSLMSASFSLRGDAQNGELDLHSPLGTTLGALQWTPQRVQLSDGSKHQFFTSLADLTEQATGAALPVEAIFGWLQGRDVQATGWLADLSASAQGSITARRISPLPEVTLRIKLDL
ncbi:lipoprotein insertase outer membrane protein LolB [Limnohabitans sp.]|jgi:outer membrane lipoprotein LolB|uniref:lipoprotein insertase outer membrane protein LolB n=1 Tax=Limnohabitans sp. TaxID=1907725 RepID=UPI002FDEC9C5